MNNRKNRAQKKRIKCYRKKKVRIHVQQHVADCYLAEAVAALTVTPTADCVAAATTTRARAKC